MKQRSAKKITDYLPLLSIAKSTLLVLLTFIKFRRTKQKNFNFVCLLLLLARHI